MNFSRTLQLTAAVLLFSSSLAMAEDKKSHTAAPAKPAAPAAPKAAAKPPAQAKGGAAAAHAGAAPAHQGGQTAHAGAGRDARSGGQRSDNRRESVGFPADQLFRPVVGPARPWYFCDAAGAYYPYVPSCASPWRPVPVGGR